MSLLHDGLAGGHLRLSPDKSVFCPRSVPCRTIWHARVAGRTPCPHTTSPHSRISGHHGHVCAWHGSTVGLVRTAYSEAALPWDALTLDIMAGIE